MDILRHTQVVVAGRRERPWLKSYERVAKGLGYVPQGRTIFSAMAVRKNIETGLVASHLAFARALGTKPKS
jgi:ABC-type branched-subunit amino acid transport system ATPase component